MPRWADWFVQGERETSEQVKQLTKLLFAYRPHPFLLDLYDELPGDAINLPSQFRPAN